MRNQRNIGYDAFNSYRSGHENPSRHDFNATHDTNRSGNSVYGQMSHNESEPDYSSGLAGSYEDHPSTRNSSSNNSQSYSSQPQNRYSNSGYSNQQNQAQNSQRSSQNWMSQSNRGQQPSGSYGHHSENRDNTGYGSYGSSNYGNSNYGRRNDDSMLERAGDQLQSWGNRMSNAWDRWTDDDDSRSSRSNAGRNNDWIRSGQHDYSHGNATQNRYSDNYGNASNYGQPHHYGNSGQSGYGNQERYSGSRSNYDSRHNDGGFFDHLGNWISNTWDNLVGNSDEEQRRYEERSRYGNAGRRTSSNDGPPYNYGSASERDYQW